MTHRYNINLFWSDEDRSWVADVPDLFPCSAFGETPERAAAEAQVVIDLRVRKPGANDLLCLGSILPFEESPQPRPEEEDFSVLFDLWKFIESLGEIGHRQ